MAATSEPDVRPAAARVPARPSTDSFRVGGAVEREALLRQLRDRAVPVLLHASDGSVLGATLTGVDSAQARLAFHVDRSHPQLEGFVDCDEAVASAWLENVHLQFALRGFVVVRGLRDAVLQCALPDEMHRFQRRESYRVRTPQRAGPVARLRHPAIPEMTLELRVLDLSVGGCALWLPDDVPPFEAGTTLAGVRIELDLSTSFGVTLTLMHISAIGPGHGAAGGGLRAGCEWQLARGEDARTLQRWIDQAQRRERQRQRGAAASA